MLGRGTAKDDNVEQRVGSKPVGAVHGCRPALAGGVQPRDKDIAVIALFGHHLTKPVGGDAAHVVVHSGAARDRLLGHVDTSEDGRRLRDTRQALVQHIRGQVIQVQVDPLAVGPAAAALANLQRHGPRHDIARRQVLGSGGVALHEALAVLVPKDATLATAALRHETASAIDPRGVELHELKVLEGQARARHHGVAVASAGVGGCGREPGPAVAARRQDGVVRAEAVQRAILLTHGKDATADPVVIHDEVQREILHEEHGVVTQGLTVQGVEHRVPSAVSDRCAAVGLPALAKVQGLAAEGTLIDFALLGARKGHAVCLELQDGLGRLLAHVFDSILVPKPVCTLDGVIEVPPPVVLGHVCQRRIDSALRSHRVRARGEELADARHIEAVLCEADSRTKTCASRTNNHRIVRVVHNVVLAHAVCSAALRTAVSEDAARRRARVELPSTAPPSGCSNNLAQPGARQRRSLCARRQRGAPPGPTRHEGSAGCAGRRGGVSGGLRPPFAPRMPQRERESPHAEAQRCRGATPQDAPHAPALAARPGMRSIPRVQPALPSAARRRRRCARAWSASCRFPL